MVGYFVSPGPTLTSGWSSRGSHPVFSFEPLLLSPPNRSAWHFRVTAGCGSGGTCGQNPKSSRSFLSCLPAWMLLPGPDNNKQNLEQNSDATPWHLPLQNRASPGGARAQSPPRRPHLAPANSNFQSNTTIPGSAVVFSSQICSWGLSSPWMAVP